MNVIMMAEGEDDTCSALKLLKTYTGCPGNILSRQVGARHRNFDRRSILLSKSVISSALQLRAVQLWVSALGLASLILALYSAVHSSNTQIVVNRGDCSLTRARSTSIRLEPEARSDTNITEQEVTAQVQAAMARSYSFGLLLNGCVVNTSDAIVSFEGAAQVLTFPMPIEYNGLVLRKSAQACAGALSYTFSNSLAFLVSGSLDGGPNSPIAISGTCGWQLEVILCAD